MGLLSSTWTARACFPVLAALLAACGGSGDPASGAPDAQPGDATSPTDGSALADQAATDGPIADAGSDVVVARRPFPQVPNTSGVTLKSPTIVTIVASNDALLTTLPSFSDAFPSSQVWSVTSAEYVLGTITSGTHLVGPAMSGTQTEAQLIAYIGQLIAVDGGPVVDGKTIFLLYLPDAASFSGTTDCGYHSSYPTPAESLGDQMAAVQRCTPNPGGETQLGQLTRTATHEIVESATDPLGEGYNLGETPATAPWMASIWQSYAQAGHVELGDLCEGTRIFEAPADGGPAGGWEYQRIWSNAAALDGGVSPCIPTPTTPYFSVTVPNDWYALPDGGTLSVPVGGWSSGTTSTWHVKLASDYATGSGVLANIAGDGGVLSTSLGPQPIPGCLTRQGMNDGVQGTIEVARPPGAASGDFAVFKVLSYHDATSCDPPLTEDDYHFWPFGVYVP